MEIVSSKVEGNMVALTLCEPEGKPGSRISIEVESNIISPDYSLAWIQLDGLKAARKKLDFLIDKLTADLNTLT